MELIDNITRLLGDDLKATLKTRSRLKVAASCFSMYAYEALKAELEKIDELRFIFTSPTFTASEGTDKIAKERKEFHIPKLDRERIRFINEQKATVIIEHLAYDSVEDKFDLDIFTAGQTKQDFNQAVRTPNRHVYDYVFPDSNSSIEREFVTQLDSASEVVVYAKLPRGFFIPTPVGDYNPDWAISFKEGSVKHVYFVAETKGSMSSMQLREIEKTKIKCARKFFDEINERFAPAAVKYDVVDSFGKLMELVK